MLNWNPTLAEVARLTEELDAARAAVEAVRKIANDYHDVDVVGDPPHEVALNPCANEILAALDGQP